MILSTKRNKGTDQAARMRRLVCACVVRNPPKTGFLATRPNYIGLQMIGSILTIFATVLHLHLYHKTENKARTGSCNTSGHSRNITDLKENYLDETLPKHQQRHGNNSNQANDGRLHACAVFCCSFNGIGLIVSLVWNIGLIVYFLKVVNS